MKTRIGLLALLTVVVTGCKKDHTAAGQQFSHRELEAFADSIFSVGIDSAQMAGGALMVYQKGDTLLKKTYGYASLELEAPMPEDAQFEIGSVTKQFTAAAILQLFQAGQLSLSDNFTKYIDFDTRGREVSIGQLLNHTSGIPGYTELPEFGGLMIQDLPRDSLVRLIETKDFLFEPGEALIYNNSAYFFLGLILEKITGKPYEEYLKDSIFEPLGMHNTYYCSTRKVAKDKAYGYDYSPEGLRQHQYINHRWPYSAGSLCSTTGDLLLWMTALHEKRFLTSQAYQKLITPDTLNDGSPLRYAMGLTNWSDYGHRQIGHGGGIPGFLSDTEYFPEDDLYIICLINTTGPKGAEDIVGAIAWKLLDKQQYKAIAPDYEPQVVEGIYEGPARGTSNTVEVRQVNGRLTLKNNGEDKTDTLSTYLGNNTWMDGNSILSIKDGTFSIDQVYGHYVLKKE